MRAQLKNRISRLLYEHGWSDGELARRTGLSRTRVNQLKNRRLRPTLLDALLIAGAFELRVSDVFHFDGDEARVSPPPDSARLPAAALPVRRFSVALRPARSDSPR
jgi:putative transcriptional regulator